MRAMKYFILSLLISNFSLTALGATLTHEGKSVELKLDKERHTYLSSNCEDVGKCFFDKAVTLKTYPNQSPGFSLCYQLGGRPFFGTIQGEKDKEPICKKGDFFANHEAILYHYRDLVLSSQK